MPRRKFRPNYSSSVSTLNSNPVQKAVKQASRRGLAKFRAVASANSLTGQFAQSGRLRKTIGWDGRKGYRLEAVASPGNAPIPIETGTSDTPPVHALHAAKLAAGRVGRTERRTRVL